MHSQADAVKYNSAKCEDRPTGNTQTDSQRERNKGVNSTGETRPTNESPTAAIRRARVLGGEDGETDAHL